MKRIFALVLSLLLVAAIFTGCGNSANSKVITIGASVTPHAEILEQIAEALAAEGYTLKIVEFNDYVQPNEAVESGELDANYFQHITYMNNFNLEHGTHLINVAEVHYEPFGIYPGKTKLLADLPEGGTIAIPNDGTNESRALLLLEANGIIKLEEGIGINATVLEIVENPKNIQILEIDAAQLARSLEDVDFAVINGNYAIQAGLNVGKDAVAVESGDSESVALYVNIIAVKEGNEDLDKIKALVKAIQSDAVRDYINSTYEGRVIPKF